MDCSRKLVILLLLSSVPIVAQAPAPETRVKGGWYDAAASGSSRGRSSLCSATVRAGANPSAANRYGITPLSLAATNGNPAIVEAC